MSNIPENIDLDNPEFQDVMKLINNTTRSVFMTGKAGTGKSTFLRYITANTKKKHVVLAPTGIAAVNAGGVTLHSFFRIPLKPLLPNDPDFSVKRIRQRMKYPQSHIKLLRSIELIVIDEISMVRADILDFIDKILRVYCGNMRQPFGGKQLLLVGDIFQLEPVATNDTKALLKMFYPNLYFFSAMVFRQTSIIPIELSRIYRQNETDFISILDRVRIGQATTEDLNRLNQRVIPASTAYDMNQQQFTMTLATQRDMVDTINDMHLERIRFPEVTYRGIVSGDFPETSMPAPLELKLKNEAQVVFIRNDFDHRWVNGTLGKVLLATADSLEVELENGTKVMVEPERWANIRYEYDEKNKTIKEIELGTFTQLPVRLAWALTIHKSQGLTFSKAVIDLGRGAFAGGQTYVALSRCRSLDGLQLKSPIRPSDIFVKHEIIDFSRWFNNRDLVDGAIAEASLESDFAESAKLWNKGDYMAAAKLFLKSNSKKNVTSDPTIARLICTKFDRLLEKERQISELNRQLREKDLRLRHIAMDHVCLGNDCCAEEEFMGALEHFNRALDIVPDLPEGLRAKGQALIHIGENELAVDVYRKLTASPLATENDYIELSRLYGQTGELHDMLEILLRSRTLFPQSLNVLKSLLSLYEELGDNSEVASLKKEIQKIKKQKKR